MGVRSIKMPDVGEGVAEAEIVEWAVKVGDLVKEDQVVAAVMTDKATVDIPTPVAGSVLALGGAVGDVLAVGAELIRIDAPGMPDSPAPAAPKSRLVQKEAEPTPSVRSVLAEPAPATPLAEPPPPRTAREQDAAPRRAPQPTTGAPRPAGEKPLASPAVRMKAREAGVDLRFVRGSGPAGRITHDDLDAFIARPPEAPAKGASKAPDTAVETIKVVGMRRRIAHNMAESSRRIAHFSYVEEIDVTALEELRASLNASATEVRPKLTLLPFLMLAIVKAVGEFPQVNAHYDDDNDVIQRFGAVHLGVATQTPNGLMVPVVRHAETLGLYQCAREMRRVSEAARQGVAARDELAGSTITLTSLGALGGIASTPIVNRPEVAIVGVNKIVVKPVWREGGFVPRKVMNLSSSFDHRVVDGYDAATFIQRLRELIEAPATIFIED
ncbi:MAG TPA: dihydrolipoamide acetyltransferase family protein [Roseiarcus sp.]|jgi:2-oxoisovalerate dehydrogenase E2 component (dihydrolipoyl transacylase)